MAESLRGKLLLASPELADQNFARSVILLIEHSLSGGAMGLILNQPTETSVREAVEQSVTFDCPLDAMLYRGGPCEGPLMVLHGDADHTAGGTAAPVLPGVWFSSEREIIEPMLEGGVEPVRFFAGYAGWGPEQLEGELATDSWTVIDAGPQQVFSIDPELWNDLRRRHQAGGILSQFDPKIIPRDPQDN